ncbi:mitogen-activated protein kinase kinase kinase [Metschnikowia aff. pulcherrima]|uniref:mitogen-activated protein kinase kinase kinase n=1 Tax=Metschnikowia aff. pulcherrima TaxID=2163413 RepID=A0A4V1ADV1_9ASCO|nr:mitogen-activated protein kinase kinase kinase [Metschnikowia aff. pulcherrima]
MPELPEVYDWLARSGCQQYHAKFVKNGITIDLLPELDTAALREIGIVKVGDRIRLEIAIAELKLTALKKRVSLNEIRSHIEKDNLPQGRTSDSNQTLLPSATTSSRIVTFILPDGSLMKVNVEGCFNAQLIKKKVLKKLGVHDDDNEYDTFVHTNVSNETRISSLYDVEFVTICFSPDRPEKHRIMLTPKNEAPTPTATEKSLRILQRMAGRKPINTNIRNFFGQRPPSELISSNLGEYFPTAGLHALEATIRNSVRQSIRCLRRFNTPSFTLNALLGRPSITSEERWYRGVHQQRTIGDVLVHNVNMLDEAKNPADAASIVSRVPSSSLSQQVSMPDDSHLVSSHRTAQSSNYRRSIMTLFVTGNNRQSRIELMSVDSDDEDPNNEFLLLYGDDASDTLEDSNSYEGRKWLQGARIGAGSFGTVYLGMNPMSGELMAVKQVPIPTGSSKQNEIQRSMITALQREMTLLKELDHENIVLYYGLSSDENFLNIFLEYIPGGSVQLMLQLYGAFEEPLIRNFIRQVLVGLSYLHGVDIIHRDIKGANILIDIKGVAKISDFGISKKVNTGDEEEQNGGTGKQAKRSSLQGLVYWMAPEVVKQTAYTKKADIWSVGCLIVEMFTGHHPFPNFSQMQAIFKIGTHTRPEVPKWCTTEGQEFLTKTFEFDYEKRPSAVDLLAEPFLAPLIVSGQDYDQSSSVEPLKPAP